MDTIGLPAILTSSLLNITKAVLENDICSSSLTVAQSSSPRELSGNK